MEKENYINEKTKEKMQKVSQKLFILCHGFSYFCNSIENDGFNDEAALGLSSYALQLQAYILDIHEKYNEIQDILDVAY